MTQKSTFYSSKNKADDKKDGLRIYNLPYVVIPGMPFIAWT